MSLGRRGAFKDACFVLVLGILCLKNYLDWDQQVWQTNQMIRQENDAPTTMNTHAHDLADNHTRSIPPPSTLPLNELANSANIPTCKDGFRVIKDRFFQKNATPSNRKIPKIIHMTSKSRCMTRGFAENIRTWFFEDYEFYFHDDAAIDRLFSQDWPYFPHLRLATRCMRSGAAKADLWRYLILWKYGGIYTDLDNRPGIFWNATLIDENDDAFFVIEHLGVLSQYFIAASPGHPLMYMAVQVALYQLLGLDHVGKQNIPKVTGPGALKVAFQYFMRSQNTNAYSRVTAGKYYGLNNRSVTVVGTKLDGFRYVERSVMKSKGEHYREMGMRHFSGGPKKKFNESCLAHLWNLDFGDHEIDLVDW